MSTEICKYIPRSSAPVKAVQLAMDMSNWKHVCEFMGYPADDEDFETPEFLYCNCGGLIVDVMPGDFVIKAPGFGFNVMSGPNFKNRYKKYSNE